ncbi:MAG: class I SAM-dependent methyltransferase [Candidatus Binatia bacterium]
MKIIPFEQFSQFLPKRGVVLEVGCGYGYVANYLSLESSDRVVIGNDPAKDRIEAAQQTVRDRKNIQFFAQDCRELEINNLDGVVIADVLHHVPFPEQKRILADVYTRLKPGGSLVMRETDIRISLRYFLFNYLLEYLLYFGSEKLNFRKAKEWREILESLGFQVHQIIPNSPFFPYITVLFVCSKTNGPRFGSTLP